MHSLTLKIELEICTLSRCIGHPVLISQSQVCRLVKQDAQLPAIWSAFLGFLWLKCSLISASSWLPLEVEEPFGLVDFVTYFLSVSCDNYAAELKILTRIRTPMQERGV